ncbi:methylmalonyl-CoA mutase family protein [Riemerella columbina]|uniref:methylmalonyl-CoA mutase family protein n=1 Tax=Riemerella columbina TaxID=103810 RepID=UPI00036372C8|nr:methylmalonyl-CoA mutase family protein [Riemerella columbina]
MFKKISLEDWESIVKKQFKTEDIYSVLENTNLEGIEVKPYYDSTQTPSVAPLSKVEESTHLVAAFQDSLEDYAYAFFIENPVVLSEKTLFFDDLALALSIAVQEDNQYISLVDIFNEDGEIDIEAGKQLLNKNFKRTLGIDVAWHQNSGASLVQQLAIALAKAKELVEVFDKDILPKIIFRMAVGSNYFFEIAKIRAFKLLFNQFSKEYQQDLVPYIFAETSMRNKTIHDKENNLIRSTLELTSAMIGGADAVFANDYDVQQSTPLSQEIAFKQNVVLAYESIINVFEDAMGGSYFVESVTEQLASNAWQLFMEMEEKGGYIEMMKSGELQNEIYEHAIEEHLAVERGDIQLIGANLYPKLEPTQSVESLYSKSKIQPVRLSEIYE